MVKANVLKTPLLPAEIFMGSPNFLLAVFRR